MRIVVFAAGIVMFAGVLSAQTTQPTTRPSGPLPASEMLNQMLRAPTGGTVQPLQPIPNPPPPDATTGSAAVAPGATTQPVIREGTFLIDRTGRLTRTADGQNWEFTFEADGRGMADPPVIILPNLKLMQMEQALKNSNRDLRFRVTGMVTEYNARNYLLLEKVVVPPEVTQQF